MRPVRVNPYQRGTPQLGDLPQPLHPDPRESSEDGNRNSHNQKLRKLNRNLKLNELSFWNSNHQTLSSYSSILTIKFLHRLYNAKTCSICNSFRKFVHSIFQRKSSDLTRAWICAIEFLIYKLSMDNVLLVYFPYSISQNLTWPYLIESSSF